MVIVDRDDDVTRYDRRPFSIQYTLDRGSRTSSHEMKLKGHSEVASTSRRLSFTAHRSVLVDKDSDKQRSTLKGFGRYICFVGSKVQHFVLVVSESL
jgi:hypothetical protein